MWTKLVLRYPNNSLCCTKALSNSCQITNRTFPLPIQVKIIIKKKEEWWKQFSVTDEAIFIWTKGQNAKKNHKMCGLDLTPL